jgi:hypothetical protein
MENHAIENMSEFLESICGPTNPLGEMLTKDILAVGCYFFLINKDQTGAKMLRELLLRLPTEKNRKLMKKFIRSIKGNEERYVAALAPHIEIFDLFLDNQFRSQ